MAKIPSIELIPSAYKSGKVYSVLPTDGSGDLNFTRASEATRVNQNGFIEKVGSNVPRIDYKDGGCPSLLLEPARTNLAQYSEDFSDAYWTKVNTNISNSVISPNGGLNGTKYTLNATSGRSQISKDIFSVGTLYTTSVFVKYDSVKYFYISNAGAGSYRVVFDIENGIIVYNGGNITSSKIENYGNGWYRCSAVFTAAYSTVYLKFSPNSNGDTFTNTTDFGYIWGAQVEQLSYATSYIPTSGATTTRNAETSSKANISNLINSSEGVLYAEVKFLANDSVVEGISINDGSISNRVVFFKWSTPNTIRVRVANTSTGNVVNENIIVNDITETQKIAIKYKLNDFNIYLNGSKVFSLNNGLTPIGLSNLSFNSDGFGASPFYGKVKDVRVYNTALTDQELQQLTSN